MDILQYVILILCRRASMDDLMRVRSRYRVTPIDILHYHPENDYFTYRDQKSRQVDRPLDLMFIFGDNDTMVIRTPQQLAAVQQRLSNNEC